MSDFIGAKLNLWVFIFSAKKFKSLAFDTIAPQSICGGHKRKQTRALIPISCKHMSI